MKKKAPKKMTKLRLSRETLRFLAEESNQELGKVAAGGSITCMNHTRCPCIK